MKNLFIVIFLFLTLGVTIWGDNLNYQTVEKSSLLGSWHNSAYGLKFRPAKGWEYKNKDDMYVGKDGSSINVQTEKTTMAMDSYVSASLKNMKGAFPDYNLIKQTTHTINGKTAYELLGTFSYQNLKMKLKSIIFEKDSEMKVVVTIGGLDSNFESNLKLFNEIQSTIVFTNETTTTTTVTNTTASADELSTYDDVKYSLSYPSSWKKSEGKIMWISTKGSSVNLLTEESKLGTEAYVNLSVDNMKKQISSYSELKREKKVINGISSYVVYGKFNMYNNDLRIYSVIYDQGSTKYILTLGGLDSNFDADNAVFLKIIDSFKLKLE